ncbi:MAG: cytochrome d ubiquinol oxidase subunit II [Bacteroidaceae bacterium]|nr:cytochrome d ubiquinol oxidase subunit II [Bacteroidaceae bacterium]
MEMLQQYWWFVVSLLGSLLVFLLFVQGANSMLFTIGKTEEQRSKLIHATGSKWELTFTTLVTFGGAFFASFPLFYSTSFGGAYWLWMVVLFSFVVQPVSYEFEHKLGNLLGQKTFHTLLAVSGVVGPLLLGGAVATFFTGSNFVVGKDNLLGIEGAGVISSWANGSHGLDALLDVWNLVLGLAVLFLARVLGALYVMNNVEDDDVRTNARRTLLYNVPAFLAFFLSFVVYVLFKDGYAVNPADGAVFMEPMKYLNNLLDMWYVLVLFLVGVVFVLMGVYVGLLRKDSVCGIWPAGIGTVLTVLALLLTVGYNNTAFYPSNADLQSSLTIQNASSSEFTLTAMAYVSILVPFVLAYIVYAWRALGKTK